MKDTFSLLTGMLLLVALYLVARNGTGVAYIFTRLGKSWRDIISTLQGNM